MIGPFFLETIVSDQLEFKVFEISTRIVAGTNLFVGGSPHADLQEPGVSPGRRIAREIRIAQKQGLLADILSLGTRGPLGSETSEKKAGKRFYGIAQHARPPIADEGI